MILLSALATTELALLASLALDAVGGAPSEIDLLYKAGLTGALAVFLWAFLTDRIVSGPSHKRVVAERDRLLELAIANSRVASRSVELAAERNP